MQKNKQKQTLHHQLPCVQLMFDTIVQYISLSQKVDLRSLLD